jgi:hypothetical protein
MDAKRIHFGSLESLERSKGNGGAKLVEMNQKIDRKGIAFEEIGGSIGFS